MQRSATICHDGLILDSRSAIAELVRERFESLSSTHKRIAEFLLERPEEGSRLSARALAELTGSSAATVVRLARVLDFDGFQAMQGALFASRRPAIEGHVPPRDDLARFDDPGQELRPAHARSEASDLISRLPNGQLASGARAGGRFVGRALELDALRGLFTELVGAGCLVALLDGEPGIGKTRLAIEFALECETRGALALYGRCDRESTLPCQPFIEALHGVLHADRPGQRRTPAAVDLALGQFAGVADMLRLTHGDSAPQRQRFVRATATLLIELSNTQPLVLVLDDLQWSDKATLHTLRQVLRAVQGAPILVLGLYRDTERGTDLLVTLSDLQRDHVVHRISLTGLSDAYAGELVGDVSRDALPVDLRLALLGRCSGNPFLLEEMSRDPTKMASGQLPHAVTDVIEERLSRLSVHARALLEMASVVGKEFVIHVIECLGDLRGDALTDALRETIEARIVEELLEGKLAFRHALVREALYSRLPQARRARLHQRVGETLEELHADTPARNAALAYHFSLAPTDAGHLRAARYAVLAAHQTILDDDARRHYGAVFALLGPLIGFHPRDELLRALQDMQAGAIDITSPGLQVGVTAQSPRSDAPKAR